MASRDLKLWRSILEMSRPSMKTLPERASKNRKRARVNDDFPAPVRPTTPILSLFLTLNEMPLNTGGKSGAYPTSRLSTSMVPEVGQAAGGFSPSRDSVSSSVYSTTRSVEFMLSSMPA